MMQHEAAPVLEKGLGNVHHKVTTASPEAQAFFDQGLKYTYGFNHEAAVRSFRHATELDPDLAMGYWGIALALGPNINMDVDPDREKQAYEAVQAARSHEAHASPKERDTIETLARRYSNDANADLHKLAADYSAAMGELSKKYPDDLDLATLYAESMMDLRPWKFWSSDGKPAVGTEEIVSVLRGVLKRDPNHLGANHYLIHAVEASPHPETALASAKRFRSLAPASGHLVHMPAHIFQRTGNYAGAAQANENAARVDREFIKKHGGESLYAAMYYNHNLQFGSASYAMDGRFADAKRMADELSSNAAAIAKQMPMVEGIVPASQLVLLRFGRWVDVIKAPVVNAGPTSTALAHFARGVAFARVGNVLGAESEQRDFEAARAKLTDDPGVFQNPQKAVGAVASEVLAGRIAEAKGDRDGAIAAYRRAVEAEDKLSYDEPPDWFYPTRETLGAALLRSGSAAEAEQVFRDDLAHNAHNPRSLYGLAAALRAQKKNAATTDAEFRKSWKGKNLRIEDL